MAPNEFEINGIARSNSNGYTAAIKRYDLLEEEQEQQLARRWQDLGDRAAADALVTSHLRLAASVARRYRRYGLPLADIISEANLGLVLAAQRFKPERGSRFSTYALWWIKASIHDYILRSWSLVKIGTTAAQKKLFFRLRTEMNKLASGTTELSTQAAEVIARRLTVDATEVIEMDRRLRGDLSLNSPVNDSEGSAEWQDLLIDHSSNAELILAQHDEGARQAGALQAALDLLTKRERRILEARHLTETPPTLEDLARELSISNERVRQIERSAFAKVRSAARKCFKGENPAARYRPRPALQAAEGELACSR
ncbi:RNA polymerase sigma factor RpoH [Bradyrhizobium sp. 61]|uniref:RNA polymerase sigma factor RpoH n=1 Tax=unclassified Bradyrhizobium TaxID=2631580 RepID=UPI001FF9AE7C|nr:MULTISPECIES: RNA polymerase sigma factor RpoH [unclassified Bradyrhizobium]MCK1277421.1 RNA polymerase sigma factor RpoH [Bradyrhizobium sp. 61]MCK1465619.1 RNA polymerase sigma factor RpoH [Bradyrhizobium sp. 2]